MQPVAPLQFKKYNSVPMPAGLKDVSLVLLHYSPSGTNKYAVNHQQRV